MVATGVAGGPAGGGGGGRARPSLFLQNNKIFLEKDFNLLLSSSLSSFEQTRKNLSKNRQE